MSQLLYLVPLLFLFGSLLGSSAPFTLPAEAVATFRAPQLAVSVPDQSVVAGEKQSLQIHLDQSAERLATLVLVVTYPNGTTERTLHSVRGSESTLTWTVPRDAGTGDATFYLSADGCACGQKGTVPPPTKLESAVEGTFQISEHPL
jgi:hypothetical protein